MKFISWNVNGIRSAWSHGLSAFLDTCKADIYAFQETKTDAAFPSVEIEGYHAYWSFCTRRKGYSGTLCLSRHRPMNVRYDMGDSDFDTEGRIITLEFEDYFFVNCYVPNSQRSEWRNDYRSSWDLRFVQYLYQLRYQKPTIVCGDFNVPVSDKDIYEESKWVEAGETGFQSTERESLVELIENGFVDTYRWIHPDEEGKYTWWSNRRFKRKQNRGWRLDYFLVSKVLKERIKESAMLTDIYGSDHCPILLEMDMEEGKDDEADAVSPSGISYTYQDLLRLEDDYNAMQRIKRTNLTRLWESIDWEQAEKHLENMQMALAKSAYTREAELIKKWQKRIVFSIDAKLLAVRHVCSTAGGAGVDCIKWSTPHEKMSAALSLDSKGYQAMPSRLLLMTAKNGKQRRIHIETYFDRAMQCLYAYALDPVAESWGDRKSFAYRKGRSAYDVCEHIRQGLSGIGAPSWVFIADVRKCYENISHDWIMEHIPMAGHVLHQFLTAGYVFGGKLFPMDTGVGIGCSISPIVANMALDGLQDYVYSRLYPNESEPDYPNGNMIRYADDVLFMARTEETAERIRQYTTEFLDERGLMLSPAKSIITHVDEGFTFMSRTYYKQGTRLFTRPSDASVERFMASIRETIENYTGSQNSLINKLNHKIDGWITYHKTGETDEVFRRMDVYINALLLKLCESKHPKWDREKILRKYWFQDAEGRYCYTLPNKKEVRVKFLSDTLPADYFLGKTNVNPYIDLDYIENRTRERQIANIVGVYRSIWNRQEGRCHYCGHEILRDDEKALVETDPNGRRFAARMAYVHKRCLYGSYDCIDTEFLPSSLDEVMILLEQLDSGKKPVKQKYYALSEFFRTCEKNSVTLTFKEIESIMGDRLGATAQRNEFWYRTGFMCISQCWLDHGYAIKALHLEGRQRVVFHLTAQSKNTSNVKVPDVIKYGRVPSDAKYELENYFQYIIKKYGL